MLFCEDFSLFHYYKVLWGHLVGAHKYAFQGCLGFLFINKQGQKVNLSVCFCCGMREIVSRAIQQTIHFLTVKIIEKNIVTYKANLMQNVLS